MARIVSVADTFDAMTTDRPYQKALQFEDAVERIKSFVGTRYDESVVAAFVAACEEGQIRPGSVRLKKPTNGNGDPKTATAPPQVTSAAESVLVS